MPIHANQILSKHELRQPVKNYRSIVDTVFPIDITIEELLKILREKPVLHDVFYFYAVDDRNRLYGVIPTRDILFSAPHKKLIEIVEEDIVTLYEDVSLDHAIKILTEHKLLSVPIVDEEYRLTGLFEIKPLDIDFSRRVKKQPTKEIQDVFQLIGFTIEKKKMDSKWLEYSTRMPWLTGNLFAGFICAAIAAYFNKTLESFVILSMFIPLVLTLSEAVSMQSMTIALRLLHYNQTSWKEIFHRLIRELPISFFMGLTSSVLLMIYYMLLYDQDWSPDKVMFVIAASISFSMIISATFGTVFPLLLHHLALDPKIAAGPVVLMLSDVMTTTVYLGLATYLLM